jgi:hypothetical protein
VGRLTYPIIIRFCRVLTTNSISSFKDIVIPPSLVHLYVLSISYSLSRISYSNCMGCRDVSWNSLSSFDGFDLPKSVIKLLIGGNKFKSLAGLKTTNNITSLYAHDIKLGNLDGVTVPDSVTALSFMNCSLTTLSDLKLPSKLVFLYAPFVVWSHLTGAVGPNADFVDGV